MDFYWHSRCNLNNGICIFIGGSQLKWDFKYFTIWGKFVIKTYLVRSFTLYFDPSFGPNECKSKLVSTTKYTTVKSQRKESTFWIKFWEMGYFKLQNVWVVLVNILFINHLLLEVLLYTLLSCNTPAPYLHTWSSQWCNFNLWPQVSQSFWLKLRNFWDIFLLLNILQN